MLRMFLVWFKYYSPLFKKELEDSIEVDASTRREALEIVKGLSDNKATVIKTLDLGKPSENSQWN